MNRDELRASGDLDLEWRVSQLDRLAIELAATTWNTRDDDGRRFLEVVSQAMVEDIDRASSLRYLLKSTLVQLCDALNDFAPDRRRVHPRLSE